MPRQQRWTAPKTRQGNWASIVLLLGLCTAIPSSAITYSYDENFRTTQYRDPALTTAHWDTVAGEIRLYRLGVALTGSLNTPDSAQDMVIAGGYAYLADNATGLLVIDVSVPNAPLLAGTANTPGSARGVALDGPYAFVADGNGGLQVVDVSVPSTPAVVATAATAGFAQDAAVAGAMAYVAQSGQGLRIFDVSVPSSPQFVTDFDTEDWAQSVTVAGDYAYVADGNGGLRVIDVHDPAQPSPAGSLPTDAYARAVALSGNLALVATAAGLQVIDIQAPSQPVSLAAVAIPGSARDVAVMGALALVAAGEAGLQVLDIATPANPILLGGYNSSGDGLGVAGGDGQAYLADGALGMLAIELTPDGFNQTANHVRSLPIAASEDPIVRARLMTTQTDSIRWELSADGGQHWEVVPPDASWRDLANPGRILLWRSTHTVGDGGLNPGCSHLSIEWQKLQSFPEIRSIADVPDDHGGQVRIVWTRSRFDSLGADLTIAEYAIYRRIDPDLDKNPSPAPAELSRAIDTEAPPACMTVLRYPPGDWDFLLTVPADCETEYATVAPTLTDATPTGEPYYTTFFIRARTATPGVYFDSPPDSGASLDNDLPQLPTGFTVAYCSGGGNQLTWDTASDPAIAAFHVYRGATADFVPLPANLLHVIAGTEWWDGTAACASHHYKLTAVDGTGRESLAVSPELITAAGRTPSAPIVLLQNDPNPFNPRTTIRFALPRSGPVKLRIYDLGGRLVRSLVDEIRPAGDQAVTWDATDRGGRPVAAGVYVYTLEAGRTRAGRRMTIVK
jgi:hypothetical protein